MSLEWNHNKTKSAIYGNIPLFSWCLDIAFLITYLRKLKLYFNYKTAIKFQQYCLMFPEMSSTPYLIKYRDLHFPIFDIILSFI